MSHLLTRLAESSLSVHLGVEQDHWDICNACGHQEVERSLQRTARVVVQPVVTPGHKNHLKGKKKKKKEEEEGEEEDEEEEEDDDGE